MMQLGHGADGDGLVAQERVRAGSPSGTRRIKPAGCLRRVCGFTGRSGLESVRGLAFPGLGYLSAPGQPMPVGLVWQSSATLCTVARHTLNATGGEVTWLYPATGCQPVSAMLYSP